MNTNTRYMNDIQELQLTPIARQEVAKRRADIVNDVHVQIQFLVAAGYLKLHLCYYEGKFSVRDRNHSQHAHEVLWEFTPTQINEGLTAREWTALENRIAGRLADLWREKHNPGRVANGRG